MVSDNADVREVDVGDFSGLGDCGLVAISVDQNLQRLRSLRRRVCWRSDQVDRGGKGSEVVGGVKLERRETSTNSRPERRVERISELEVGNGFEGLGMRRLHGVVNLISSLVLVPAGDDNEMSTVLIRYLQRDINRIGGSLNTSRPCRRKKPKELLLLRLSLDNPNRNPIHEPCVDSGGDADARLEEHQDVPESTFGKDPSRNVVQNLRGAVYERWRAGVGEEGGGRGGRGDYGNQLVETL